MVVTVMVVPVLPIIRGRCILFAVRRLLVIAVVSVVLPRASLHAQKPAPAIVLVRVTDTTGAPLSGAELVLLKGAKEAVLLATSDAAGKHTFSFAPEDAHYQLVVKKGGFVQRARLVPVAPGDTFSIQLSLAQLPRSLDTVRVTDQRAFSSHYFIGADEIANSGRYINNVWDAVRKLRPDMIEDKDRCPKEPLKYIWVNGERLPAEDVPTSNPQSPPPRFARGRGGRGGGSGRPQPTAPLASRPVEPGSLLD